MRAEIPASDELQATAKLRIELDKRADRETPQFFQSVVRTGYYYADELREAAMFLEQEERQAQREIMAARGDHEWEREQREQDLDRQRLGEWSTRERESDEWEPER